MPLLYIPRQSIYDSTINRIDCIANDRSVTRYNVLRDIIYHREGYVPPTYDERGHKNLSRKEKTVNSTQDDYLVIWIDDECKITRNIIQTLNDYI